MRIKLTKRGGFALVEVMIVAGIVSLLSAVAIPNLLRSRVDGNEASAQASLKSISNGFENYYAINNIYPTDPNDLLTPQPPYLNKDYFTGIHNGYTYTPTLADYSYSIVAAPTAPSQGIRSFTISTGGLLQEN